MFQSSFELTGYITVEMSILMVLSTVFQSSFELTGYITIRLEMRISYLILFQSSFELTGYITIWVFLDSKINVIVSKLFRAYRLYNL